MGAEPRIIVILATSCGETQPGEHVTIPPLRQLNIQLDQTPGESSLINYSL